MSHSVPVYEISLPGYTVEQEPDFLAIGRDVPEQRVVLAQRDREEGADVAKFAKFADSLIAYLTVGDICDLDERFTTNQLVERGARFWQARPRCRELSVFRRNAA